MLIIFNILCKRSASGSDSVCNITKILVQNLRVITVEWAGVFLLEKKSARVDAQYLNVPESNPLILTSFLGRRSWNQTSSVQLS